MPSFSSTQSIHAYDRTLHLLNSSLMLVSISEDGEYHHHDSPMMVRQNANLRRDSFGNQSCKTGLDELANAHPYSNNNNTCGMSPPRSTNTPTPLHGYHRCGVTSKHDVTGWGFFIDE